MPDRPTRPKANPEKKRQAALRRSMLSPAVVALASRTYRPFTMGAMPLAEEMELTIFAPPELTDDGAPIKVAVSENEEIRQMSALAWAHDTENDLATVVLPALADGSWRDLVKIYLLTAFQPGEFFALYGHMRDFQEMVHEATIVVARRSGSGAPGAGLGE